MARDARDAILALLAGRAPEATLCPSEVARAITPETESAPAAWRGAMPTVHDAVDRLLGEGLIRLSWKGDSLPARAGPYRISAAAAPRRATGDDS